MKRILGLAFKVLAILNSNSFIPRCFKSKSYQLRIKNS